MSNFNRVSSFDDQIACDILSGPLNDDDDDDDDADDRLRLKNDPIHE